MDLLVDEEFLKYYNQDIIAKSAIKTLYDISLTNKNKEAFEKLFAAKEIFEKKHPHNATLRNSFAYFLYKLDTHKITRQSREKYNGIIKKIHEIGSLSAEIGVKKIRPGSVVFAHSVNNQVFETLINSAKHKHFKVNLVEHAPFDMGKYLKEKLESHDIEVRLFADIHLENAVKQADIAIFGTESLLNNKGTVAKSGSNTAAKISKEHNVPTYFCTNTLKYDPKGQTLRGLQQQYEHDHHDHRQIFEFVPKENISAYISEFGIIRPKFIVEEMQFHHSRLFRKTL